MDFTIDNNRQRYGKNPINRNTTLFLFVSVPKCNDVVKEAGWKTASFLVTLMKRNKSGIVTHYSAILFCL